MTAKKTKPPREMILDLLKEKAGMKQEVYRNTLRIFGELREVLKDMAAELQGKMEHHDKAVSLDYRDRGPFEAELEFGSDVLIFHMHTNVFSFDSDHAIWKTSYIKEENARSYCGMINVFNFLRDSFKYNRMNDLGYMVGRVFVNRESHFFMEGKRQLGFLYNDFVNGILDKDTLRKVVESAMIYALDFDLLTPPYDDVKMITLQDMNDVINNMNMKTGKRLGFKFQADGDDVEA